MHGHGNAKRNPKDGLQDKHGVWRGGWVDWSRKIEDLLTCLLRYIYAGQAVQLLDMNR